MSIVSVAAFRLRLIFGLLSILAPAAGHDAVQQSAGEAAQPQGTVLAQESSNLYSSDWVRRRSKIPFAKAAPENPAPKKPAVSEARVSGTGFFITYDGVVVTARHVIEGKTQLTVLTANGPLPAQVFKVSEEDDVALLRCDLGSTLALPLSLHFGSDEVRFGESVFTVGFPNPKILGREPKLARGEITSLAGLQDDPKCWQTSLPVLFGNSGGPMLDETGRVIGVITSKINPLEAVESFGEMPSLVAYSLKADRLLPLLESAGVKLEEAPVVSSAEFVEAAERARESVVMVLAR